jgi:hypothetical protein
MYPENKQKNRYVNIQACKSLESAASYVLKCKTIMIPILMHQMQISSNQVSLVVLGPKKLETEKKLWKLWKSRKITKKQINIVPWNWPISIEG